MNFLHEKQSRRYFIFLTGFCALLLGFAVIAGQVQAQTTKKVLLERERMIASALLSQGISPSVAANAYKDGKITSEGIAFLEKIGRAGYSNPWILPSVHRGSAVFLFFAVSAAGGLSAILLVGAFRFLMRREELYAEAERIIAKFAEGDFAHHLRRDQEGTLYQMFGAADRLSMALQAKSETALSAKEALKDTVSDISHQLKTPLAALNMYAEIIREEPDKPQIVLEFTQKSMQSLERVETLVQTLLKVMRLDAGSIVFGKKTCRVSELVSDAIGELLTRAKQEKKRILTEGDPDGFVSCDTVWTAEAVSNLVKNALDHTKEGGTVRIGWERSPAMLRLWVADDGSGIDVEDMPHIFKRFYRSKNSSDTQGAGLGLALAKSVVEGQGGNLSVTSVPGEGTVFYISFFC